MQKYCAGCFRSDTGDFACMDVMLNLEHVEDQEKEYNSGFESDPSVTSGKGEKLLSMIL